MKIRTLKTKKNIKKVSKNQNIESIQKSVQNIEIDEDQNIKIDKDQNVESSWSLNQKSERQKEHQKSICLIFKFWQSYFSYGVSTYGVLALKNKS